jgi:diacylglycerol kinase (ATP)
VVPGLALWVRWGRATANSLAGFRAALAHEAAFRDEITLFCILAPAGALLGRNGVERALLVGSLFLVLAVERLNSAVESVVDRFGPERHELSKRAKDMGSAAVTVSLFSVLAVGAFVLADYWG